MTRPFFLKLFNPYFHLLVIIFFSIFLQCSNDKNNPASTNSSLPILTTSQVSLITDTSARSGGVISSDDGEVIIKRGVCWGTSQTPDITNNSTNDGSGVGAFSSDINGLNPQTKYYLRAYAENTAGISYGDSVSFTTNIGTLTDIDGNIYKTVKIGEQVWMAENLKVTRYRNGDIIQNIVDNSEWLSYSGAYCSYNNDPNNVDVYGLLYNWYALDDARKIAPDGWHVPTNSEWNDLGKFLGSDAGGQMKETGLSHWMSPNDGATNTSSFSALPGGYRSGNGSFGNLSAFGYYWTGTQANSSYAFSRILYFSSPSLGSDAPRKLRGKSVRLIKD